jgi:chorismate mutase / prephenate dehydratase
MKKARHQELRNNIKLIDQDIVRLLNRRAEISLEIGRVKAELGIEVYDPSHERTIYENLAEMNGGALPLKSLRAIFREIISASRMLQSPITVAYLGPEASFAHMAAQSHFGASSLFFPQASIARVFKEVEKEKAKWGVAPVENSIEGSVNLTLDKLITTTLNIRAEILLRITQCLLSSHKRIDEIEKVYSHPQALAQCQEWLRANLPNAALIEVESTAAAAQRVVKEKKGAAIGSKAAADTYGLTVLSEGIEDKASNTTRFIVIGEGESKPTGKDKTSLLFATPHTPGALYRALQSFADRGINMMKIESYPVKDRLWEYLFFVDIAGHVKDEDLKHCLDDLRRKTTFLKILGSYPQSEDLQ